jgi:hypothetical protein
MDQRTERITWGTLAGFLVLTVFIAVVAVPVSIWVGGGGRPLVIQIAAGLFCAVVLYRLARVVREEAGIGEASQADLAMEPKAMPVNLDPILLRLTRELPIFLRWHIVPSALLDRLRQLSTQRAGGIPPELVSGPGHLVTWQDAERIVDFLERAT